MDSFFASFCAVKFKSLAFHSTHLKMFEVLVSNGFDSLFYIRIRQGHPLR